MKIREQVDRNRGLITNIQNALKELGRTFDVIGERERMYCIDLAHEAAEYTPEEAMSVCYILAQKYPKILLQALAMRMEDDEE